MMTPTNSVPEIEYPDGDGQRIAESTLQFDWIAKLYNNLEWLFWNDPTVFVAGDLLWYPVEGRPDIRTAPDALVAFGRPKGRRGSYQQWQEGGIAPQVVFEVLPPDDRPAERQEKLDFYERYGVEEFYCCDPHRRLAAGFVRFGQALQSVSTISGWTSPRLGIRFELVDGELQIYRPDGKKFLTFVELARQIDADKRSVATAHDLPEGR
jgi:Uma2 family endonuclease